MKESFTFSSNKLFNIEIPKHSLRNQQGNRKNASEALKLMENIQKYYFYHNLNMLFLAFSESKLEL